MIESLRRPQRGSRPDGLPGGDFVAVRGTKGVFIAVGDIPGDGVLDFVLRPDKGSAPEVRVIDPSGAPGGPLTFLEPYGPGDKRGVFVGAASR